MDNAQKAIMIGVGLFITIIIISAVMLITSAGQDMVDDSMGKLDDITSQLSSSEWNSLDDKFMNGSQVIAYVKKYYKSTDILCYYESTNETMVCASSAASAEVSKGLANQNVVKDITVGTPGLSSVGLLTNTAKTGTYVSASANYKARLIKTTSGDNVGVYFDKQ